MNRRTSEVIVATYNVHGCRGTDGLVDADRVAEVICDLSADVVGLQEVDCRVRGPDGSDQLSRLAAATGFQAVPGPTIREQSGYYGNAVLTRHRVIDVLQTDLSYRQREPRGVMDVILRIGAAAVRVVVTHFGLQARERRHQVSLVLSILRAQKDQAPSPRSSDALVLLGDFNEWRPNAITLARLHEALGRAPAVRTFPSRFPLLALDRIWVCPNELLIRSMALKTPAARIASDHLPLRAVLDLTQAEGAVVVNDRSRRPEAED